MNTEFLCDICLGPAILEAECSKALSPLLRIEVVCRWFFHFWNSVTWSGRKHIPLV